MNHLLIWEQVPDGTQAYVLSPSKHQDLINLAEMAHGHYINAEDNDAVIALNEALPSLEGAEYDTQQNGSRPISGGPFAAVYICGFVL